MSIENFYLLENKQKSSKLSIMTVKIVVSKMLSLFIGCIHGHCNDQAFECICHDDQRWQGDHCDEPICKEGCLHGYCQSPQECM